MSSLKFDFANSRATRPPRASAVASVDWLLCFTSLCSLLLVEWTYSLGISGAPMMAVLAFLMPTFVIAIIHPSTAFEGVVKNWPLFALPALALLSVFWSDYPQATEKAALEYLVTIAIGTLLASCVQHRVLLSSLLTALALVTLLGLLFGQISAWNGQLVMLGLSGSKNSFGYTIAQLLLIGFVVAFDRSQSGTFRSLGFISIALAPPLLVFSRSAGALVFSAATICLVLMIMSITRLPPLGRLFIALTIIPCFLIGVICWLLFGNFDELLAYLGKDITLSGRIYIWQQAIASIEAHPILGVGYQAFWQVGNWASEVLWEMFGVSGKMGFHFHNLYFQVGVDLGLVGLSVLVATLLLVVVRAIKVLLHTKLRAQHVFAISQFIFMLLSSPVEVGLFAPFSFSSITLCIAFIYLGSSQSSEVLRRQVEPLPDISPLPERSMVTPR
jgi:exopolysaccharide production protein ExoQ